MLQTLTWVSRVGELVNYDVRYGHKGALLVEWVYSYVTSTLQEWIPSVSKAA